MKNKIIALLALLFLGALNSLSSARAQSSFGNALALNGAGQYVAVPTSAASAVGSPFTIEARVFVRDYASGSRLLDFSGGGSVNELVCALSAGTSGQPALYFFNRTGTITGSLTSPSPLPLNAWTHLAFTYDGTNGSIFINGILTASGAMPPLPLATRTSNFIGHSNQADRDANVLLNEFRIWAVARSPAQIQAGLGAPLVGNESGLRLYYRFDSASGTVATNSATATGAASNGTLAGGPVWVPDLPLYSYIVTEASDAGPGSLRVALASATNGTMITFDPALNGQTIRLTSGQLAVGNNVTILGPGANLLAIDGGHTDRVFYLAPGLTNLIAGLTVTNGYADDYVRVYFGGSDYQSYYVGGGIDNDGAVLTVSNVTLSGNSGASNQEGALGGAIFSHDSGNNGTLTLENCALSGNSATWGGAIFNVGGSGSATLTLRNCTLNGNSALESGGGIYNGSGFGTSTSTLANCTLSGNSALSGGGGIINDGYYGSSATLTLVNCTLGGNSASGGGGIYNLGSYSNAVPLILSNSIVAGSSPVIFDIVNAGGMVIRQGANIVPQYTNYDGSTNSGPAALTGNPRLAPLGYYGGPTQTMPPMPGSPALGGCLLGCGLTTDQRGFPRPEYDNGDGLPVADIGAVEGVYNPAGPGVLTGLSFPRPGWNRFEFTAYNGGGPYTVFATTNLALPFSAWSNLGTNVVVSPLGSSEFIFNDTQATNVPLRFYRVTSP